MSEAVAAGWYPDPDDGGVSERFWDGNDWTEKTRPAEPEPAVAAGWYPDPDDGGASERYWDGDDWTERTREPVAAHPKPAPRPGTPNSPASSRTGLGFGVPTAARVFTVGAVALNLVFLFWAIASGGSGIALFLWAAFDLIFAMLWVVARLTKSQCPDCGIALPRDVVECGACGYNFHSDAFPFADASR